MALTGALGEAGGALPPSSRSPSLRSSPGVPQTAQRRPDAHRRSHPPHPGPTPARHRRRAARRRVPAVGVPGCRARACLGAGAAAPAARLQGALRHPDGPAPVHRLPLGVGRHAPRQVDERRPPADPPAPAGPVRRHAWRLPVPQHEGRLRQARLRVQVLARRRRPDDLEPAADAARRRAPARSSSATTTSCRATSAAGTTRSGRRRRRTTTRSTSSATTASAAGCG